LGLYPLKDYGKDYKNKRLFREITCRKAGLLAFTASATHHAAQIFQTLKDSLEGRHLNDRGGVVPLNCFYYRIKPDCPLSDGIMSILTAIVVMEVYMPERLGKEFFEAMIQVGMTYIEGKPELTEQINFCRKPEKKIIPVPHIFKVETDRTGIGKGSQVGKRFPELS
jgi:hypothetical protein